jgi:small subunit ribosomal protein S20
MPHTEHAKKSHRKSEARRARNRAAKSQLKTALKAARASMGQDGSAAALSAAEKRLDKAARSRLIHPNKAARVKSRMAKAANKAKKSS